MEIAGVAARLKELPTDLVEEAVQRFDVLAKEAASRVVGGGATMRMHTKRGRVAVPLGTRSNVSGGGGTSVTVFINGTPKAQWRWIEDGTKPHMVGRGRGVFLKGPKYAHPMRAPLFHPGTQPGAKAWTRAIDEFRKEFPDIAIDRLKEIAG